MAHRHIKIEGWVSEIEVSSEAKLKLPLLTRNKESGLLNLNFDPALVELLREVKYFLIIELNVPAVRLWRR